MSLHLRQGACLGCGVIPGVVVLGDWGRMSRDAPLRAGSAGARVCPGVAGVAHSRMLRVGGNRGIMRNSKVSSGRGLAPMCADPPHRTWEPDHHTPRSPENPVISTKNSPRPAEPPASHVQHRRQPHPPGTPHRYTTNPPPPTRHCPRCPDTLQSRAGTRPISARNTADLEPEVDRSRHGVRPISRRKWTDLGAEYDRSRRGGQ